MWRHPEEKSKKKKYSKKTMTFSFFSYLKDFLLYTPPTTMGEWLNQVSIQMEATTSKYKFIFKTLPT